MHTKFDIFSYTAENGKCPFENLLKTIKDKKTKAIIDTRLTRISLGLMGDWKKAKGASGIFELRIDYGPGYRVYFSQINRSIIILLLGGDKKTQDDDIQKATIFLEDYRRRYG